MKYAFHKLGYQPEGTTLAVRLQGTAANVLLVDPANFVHYRAGRGFFFSAGGYYTRSPVELTVPSDGEWFLVIDHGGYSGRVRASVEIIGQGEQDAVEDTTEEAVSSS
jgi:hypothetical protein